MSRNLSGRIGVIGAIARNNYLPDFVFPFTILTFSFLQQLLINKHHPERRHPTTCSRSYVYLDMPVCQVDMQLHCCQRNCSSWCSLWRYVQSCDYYCNHGQCTSQQTLVLDAMVQRLQATYQSFHCDFCTLFRRLLLFMLHLVLILPVYFERKHSTPSSRITEGLHLPEMYSEEQYSSRMLWGLSS